jgi:hypothetical protein
LEILKMLVVFCGNGQLAATTTEDGLGPSRREGDQFGYRLLVAGDDDFFTWLQVFDNLWQGGLSFWDGYSRHGSDSLSSALIDLPRRV